MNEEREKEEGKRQAETRATRKLNAEEEGGIVLPTKGLAYGTDTDALRDALELECIPLPKPSKRRKTGALKQPWRVALMHSNPNMGVIGLEIHDDVVLGRAGTEGEDPDLDLSVYNALEHGVSRRHALLRPTATQLFLIDLGSTNGTQVNAIPLGAGIARALKHNDEVSLGDLYLSIKILRAPEAADQKKSDATDEEKE